VPVIVRLKVPLGVLLLVVTVRVEAPLPVTDGGLKVAVVRDGKPLTLRFTVPEKPFAAVTVTL
jgi:hypothetical protein